MTRSRFFPKGCHIRASETNGRRELRGFAPIHEWNMMFDWWSQAYYLEKFSEKCDFEVGSAEDGADCFGLYNHNADDVLGRTKNKTVKVDFRQDGLHYTLKVPKTSRGEELWELASEGTITDTSFAFIVDEYEMEKANPKKKQLARITYTKARLMDVSPCTRGAWSGATLNPREQKTDSGRSLFEDFALKELKNLEVEKNLLYLAGWVEQKIKKP